MQKNLTQKQMIAALSALDVLLTVKVSILIGGGGAMILAHKFPLATSDIDAVAKGIELFELDPLVKKVAEQLSLPKIGLIHIFLPLAMFSPKIMVIV
jgi:hypothetical protein